MTEHQPGTSHGIIILGMHRSGTSAVTRGVQALGADLGGEFLAPRFDNPTGYWENKSIVELHDRLLAQFGMTWEDPGLIDDSLWSSAVVKLYAAEIRHYVAHHFLPRPVWAFKDPRTLRMLPLWRDVLHTLHARTSYLLVLRNPLSVAASLYRRQAMPAAQAHRLWLAYLMPYLSTLLPEPCRVVDFDLFMDDPAGQLERLATLIDLPMIGPDASARNDYLQAFLRADMRHERFDDAALDVAADLPPVGRDAYLLLRRLATDELSFDSASFQTVWTQLECDARKALAG
jgi:O-antigen biosynthesis protein